MSINDDDQRQMNKVELSNGNHRYEEEIEELKERIKELEDWNDVDRSTKTNEFHLLNERYRQLEIDYQRLQIQQKNNELALERLDEYEETISQLQNQLDQIRFNEKKCFSKENQRYELVERQLNERIENLEKEKIELCQQIESIQTTTPGAPPTHNFSSDFISIYQQFSSLLPKEFSLNDDEENSLVDRFSNLFEQISSYIGTFSILQDELESLKQILNEKQDEIVKLQNDFESNENPIDRSDDEEENDDELEEILQFQSRTSSRQSLFSTTHGEKQQLLAQNEILSCLLNEKEQELISFQQAEKFHDETIENFQTKIISLENELRQIREENSSLKNEKNILDEKIFQFERNQNDFGKSRVEKHLVKNILLSFFQTPLDKQFEVLPILGALVDFTQDDYQKAMNSMSIQHQTNSSWFTGWLTTSKPTVTMTNQSFAELLIEYVDQQSDKSTDEKTDRISSSPSIEDV